MDGTALEGLRAGLRAQFPPMQGERAPVFLDNAAGSLMPARVVDAVAAVLTSRGSCNSMAAYSWGRTNTELKSACHDATGVFVNAPRGGLDVALHASSTSLSFRLCEAFAHMWGPGDAVIISELEHECNASPWRQLTSKGVEVRTWRAHWPQGRLDVDDLTALLGDGHVRLVALTACSNALGLTTPVQAAATAAHAAGAWIVVDAVHSAPHLLPDVQRDDVDFLFFSPYKILAPHLGALYVRPGLLEQLHVPTIDFYANDEMQKFELGTPAFEAMAGWMEALAYLNEDVGGASRGAPITRDSLEAAYAHVAALEAPVRAALAHGLAKIDGVTVYGDLDERVGTAAFNIHGRAAAEVARELSDSYGVFVSSGHFYATLPLGALGLLPGGVVRVSIAHYNSVADIDALLAGVREIVAGNGQTKEHRSAC